MGVHCSFCTGQFVAQAGALHPAIGAEQVLDFHVAGHQRPVADGRAGGRDDEAGIITLSVEVLDPPHETTFTKHRFPMQEAALAQQGVPPHIAEGGEDVVEADPCP